MLYFTSPIDPTWAQFLHDLTPSFLVSASEFDVRACALATVFQMISTDNVTKEVCAQEDLDITPQLETIGEFCGCGEQNAQIACEARSTLTLYIYRRKTYSTGSLDNFIRKGGNAEIRIWLPRLGQILGWCPAQTYSCSDHGRSRWIPIAYSDCIHNVVEAEYATHSIKGLANADHYRFVS